ncbi:MAG: hypothetical protein V3V35_04505 [Dehalococcoidia bacterium]
MPKSSKRIAARQAALAKRKKKTGPRPAVIYQPSGSPATTQASVVAVPAAPPAGAEVPEFEVPERARGPLTPSAAARATPAIGPRRGLPASPYLRTDLGRTAKLAGVLLVVLVVLAFVLG